jgi:hypothetical protein
LNGLQALQSGFRLPREARAQCRFNFLLALVQCGVLWWVVDVLQREQANARLGVNPIPRIINHALNTHTSAPFKLGFVKI